MTTSEKIAADIYRDAMQALDAAEELGGPDVPEYVALMRAIAEEALRRAESAEA